MATITIKINTDAPVTQGVAQALAQQVVAYADAGWDDVFRVTSVEATQDSIDRVWQYENESDRIHYASGGRRLYADRGSVLFEMLAAEIRDRAGV